MEKLANQTLQKLEFGHFPWKQYAIKHTLSAESGYTYFDLKMLHEQTDEQFSGQFYV